MRKDAAERQICLLLACFTALTLIFHSIGNAASMDEIMPKLEVQAGMEGIGKTVFQGVKIEEFNVQILGILEKVLPGGGDLILARLSGGPLDKTGVIAGMSGSPIYINGRLIGALSYAWGFSKEPICGITPIEDMLRLSNVSHLEGANTEMDSGSGSPSKLSHNLPIVPLGTILMVNGFDNSILEQMKNSFKQYNIIPMAGGGSVREKVETSVLPGSAVGVQLMRGDMDISAIGTVTYRDGDNILAFGHPFLWMGRSDFPLTSAYVHTIMPSHEISFKLASSLEMVGRINQDRVSGIAGSLNEFPKLVPASIMIRDKDSGYMRTYNVEVLDSKVFTPMLMEWAVTSAVMGVSKLMGENTVKATQEIFLEDREPIRLENLFYNSSNLSEFISFGGFTRPIHLLMDNQFGKVKFQKVQWEIEIQDERKTVRIEDVYLKKIEVEPGDEVILGITLKAFSGEVLNKEVTIKLPDDLPQGIVMLGACGGGELMNLEAMLGLPPSRPVRFLFWETGEYPAHNLNQLIRLMEEEEKNNDLVVVASLPKNRVDILGEKLSSLPQSMIDIMRNSTGTSVKVEMRDELKVSEPTDWVISGIKTLNLVVKKKKGFD